MSKSVIENASPGSFSFSQHQRDKERSRMDAYQNPAQHGAELRARARKLAQLGRMSVA